MKMKSKLMMFTAAFAFSANMAAAAITAQDVVNTYQTANYSGIEVVEGPTQIKVEAIKNGVKIEVIYDKASGDTISSEQHSVSGVGHSGVEVRTSTSDFSGDAAGHDDGAGHDAGDDHGSDDGAGHDAGDDHGSDDGAGHDAGDDHGGNDGAGHDAGDDHGGDDN